MVVNRCVSCGAVMPEGDHICKQCLEDTVRKEISVTDEMLKMKFDPVMLSFHNVDVKIENSVLLLECLIKYYIFTTNMDFEGQFSYRFVCENIMPGESVGDAANRLFTEYTDVVNTIESMIIEK